MKNFKVLNLKGLKAIKGGADDKKKDTKKKDTGYTEVTGLSAELEVIDYRDGDDNF